MAKLRAICLLLLLVSLVGCSTINVHYDYDQAADFNNLQTFAFRSTVIKDDALAENPLLKKRVIGAVEQYFAGRGYTKAAENLPDMYIVLHAGQKEKMRVTDWGFPGDFSSEFHYGSRWGYPYYYGSRVDVSYYTETTLVIDIFSARPDELIWRGSGTSIVRHYKTQEEMQQAIDQYVAEILVNFPPGNEEQ